jgi:hypothetical protein
VTVVGQGGRGDLGDVPGVHERGAPVTGGQGQDTVEDSWPPEVLAEVLREPVWAQDGPVDTGAAHRLFRRMERVAVVARGGCRQEHQPPCAGTDRLVDEGGHALPAVQARLQAGFEDVNAGDSVECRSPGRRRVQVEEDVATGTGRPAHRLAGGLQPAGDTTTGLSRAAEDEVGHVIRKRRPAKTVHG